MCRCNRRRYVMYRTDGEPQLGYCAGHREVDAEGFCCHTQGDERMTTEPMNVCEHAAEGARPGSQGLLDDAREAANAASDPARQRPAPASSDAAALCNALAISA